jgi:hypothetical protein
MIAYRSASQEAFLVRLLVRGIRFEANVQGLFSPQLHS